MEKSTKFWLAFLFLVVVGVRLLVAFQSEGLNYDAYQVLRQVDNIKETGVPLFKDSLSYGGRSVFFSPLYHYVLGVFSLVIPSVIVLKLIPNILMSLLVFVVFFLSYYSIKNEKIALVTAAFSGFVPVVFTETINNASVYTAVVPLFFLVIHFFLQTNRDENFMPALLVSMVVLTLIHPVSLLLAFGFLVYLLLLKVLQFRESLRESEVVLFFLFLVFWLNMIIYKKALAMHADAIIWQNLPSQLIEFSYTKVTFLQSIFGIGVVPLIFGLVSIYMSLFGSKKKTVTMMLSVCFVIFVLLWFRFIELYVGLIFLGVALTVLSSYSLLGAYDYAGKLKLKGAPSLFVFFIFVILVVTFIPNLGFALEKTRDVPSSGDVAAFEWLKNNTHENSVVLVMPEEGSVMSYFSSRKNVIDENFLLVNNINRRYEDVYDLYDERFITSALDKLNYYSVDYVVLSERTGFARNISSLGFESDCVSRVFPEGSDAEAGLPGIYKVNCVLRQR